mgnify:CR=1 FL=1
MKKISTKEFIWYAAAGLIVVAGLILMIFGIVGYNVKGTVDSNFILKAEQSMSIGFRFLGLIIMVVGILFGVIVLLVNSKRADRDIEKQIRRQQRISAQANTVLEVKKAVEVVEEPKE